MTFWRCSVIKIYTVIWTNSSNDKPTLPSYCLDYHLILSPAQNVSFRFSNKVQMLQGRLTGLDSRLTDTVRYWWMCLPVPAGVRGVNSSLLPCSHRHLCPARLIGSGQVKVCTLVDPEWDRQRKVEQNKSYVRALIISPFLYLHISLNIVKWFMSNM